MPFCPDPDTVGKLGNTRPVCGTTIDGGTAGILQRLLHPARVRQQALARRRQVDATRVAVEQGQPKFFFQRADAGGDVRLHGMQRLGRAVHAAEPGHRFEDAEI